MKKNKHVKRLSRGLRAFCELLSLALATGFGIGAIYMGFKLGVATFGNLAFVIATVTLIVLFLSAYMLGLADEADEKLLNKKPD